MSAYVIFDVEIRDMSLYQEFTGDIGVRPQYRRYFGLQPYKNGCKQLLNE